MSWSLTSTCWNCKKLNEGCKDFENLNKGVIIANQTNTNEGHMGSGNVIVHCHKMVVKDN